MLEFTENDRALLEFTENDRALLEFTENDRALLEFTENKIPPPYESLTHSVIHSKKKYRARRGAKDIYKHPVGNFSFEISIVYRSHLTVLQR